MYLCVQKILKKYKKINMITSISLENFKCFKERTTFPFSKINLLTGKNGRGKSTILQSMLLMKQSVEENKYTPLLNLRGDAINIGTFQDLCNLKKEKKVDEDGTVVIQFTFKNAIVQTYFCEQNLYSLYNVVIDIHRTRLMHAHNEYINICLYSNINSQQYDLRYSIINENNDIMLEISENHNIERFLLQEKQLLNLPEEVLNHADYPKLLAGIKELNEQNVYFHIHFAH